ncbi:MAG: hypothetical protein LBJ31_02480 [Treponema sp.]|nr:hypothetical protein [Treponema sp.]
MTEGFVEHFNPMSENTDESFEVNGVKFSYSINSASAAFKQVKINGGPIRDGIYVKIFYINNDILVLWINSELNP